MRRRFYRPILVSIPLLLIFNALPNASGAHAHRHRHSLKRSDGKALSPRGDGILPTLLANKLLIKEFGDNDPLYVLFTGDPQYHVECTTGNVDCKRRSADCRGNMSDAEMLAETFKGNKKMSMRNFAMDVMSSAERCLVLESMFANDVQRKSIFNLNRRLAAKNISIVALVINGDLTHHGHSHQLEQFKDDWLSLPIPAFVGLGNHDYENNVNDCFNNQCADRMLSWFVNEYAPKLSLPLDYDEENILWKSQHHGSLAYAVNFCSRTRTNCVHSVQLHNRADYWRQFDSVGARWDIRPSLSWLAADLGAADTLNTTWPVLINLHDNNDPVSAKRLRTVIEQWLRRPENENRIRRVMVLFAHLHDRHSLSTECIAGVKVPFLYVGSVPNNRYTLVKFSGEIASIFFMKANADSTTTVLNVHQYRWTPC